MKNIKNDKKLEKNMGAELNETQMDDISGGGMSGVETDVKVSTGDIKLETGNLGLVNTSAIKANINMNTSGDNNTVQNNGGISIGGK